MPLTAPAPSNKRKKAIKIITDLSSVSQNDDECDPEASELDLGTKIKMPKDTMLEELSLNKNRGSKMFKMRQQRVEKFIVTAQNKQNLEKLLMFPPPVAPKPEKAKDEVMEHAMDEEAENEKRRKEYAPTYISPWERAMKGNEELTSTMKAYMPGPIQMHREMPLYKSFNRTALPFGGYDKVPKKLTFEFQELNGGSEEPEPWPSMQANIGSRPSFNRTPIGWVCSEDNPNIHMDLDSVPFDGETDDL
ncbi:myozenin-1b isoform X1 [Pseudoliparis swirei]|uniref:myozenin-1b isoform X1 n=1 Tax=Pseudoliparis swirei TaxID=2059687 RepID=UPI0024BDEB58|nr:myozenin-1b isoform X1 [Pseudoliparis swirei]